MRRIWTLGFVVVIIMAAGACEAVASPVYEECVKQSGGHYTTKECSAASEVATGGKYEREQVAPGARIAVKGKIGLTKFTAPMEGGETVLECKSGKATGRITGPGSGETALELKGCSFTSNLKSLRCETPGGRSGVITMAELSTELVELPGGKPGMRLSAAGPLFEATCTFFGGMKFVFSGSVLGELAGNIGVASKEQQLDLRVTPGGRQEFTDVEGGFEGEDELIATITDATEDSGPAGLQADETSKTKAEIGIF